MPRANVEVVAQVYDAMGRRDVAAIMGLLAPDIEITQSTEVPWGGTYRGPAEVLQFFAKLVGNITSSVAIERFIDAADHVVVIGRTQGTVNATGQSFDVPIAHVWEIKEGQAIQALFCIDNPTMLAALASSP